MFNTVRDPATTSDDFFENHRKSKLVSAAQPKFIFSILITALLFLFLPSEVFDAARIGGQECSKIDPITGFIHLKNKRVIWKQEGFSSGTTNSLGFVDRDHQIQKPKGVCRIAFLGDSMTESLQVEQGKRFSNLLEEKLNRRYPGKFEILNFGVSAASTGQDLLTYLRYVEQFSPDITVLCFDDGDEDKNGRKPVMSTWHPHVVFQCINNEITASWRDFDSWVNSVQAMPIVLFEANRTHSRLWGALIQMINVVKTDKGFIDFCNFLDHIKMLAPVENALAKLFPVRTFGPSEFRLPQSEIDLERKSFCSKHHIIYADHFGSAIPKFDERDFEFGREAIYHTTNLTEDQVQELKQFEIERWSLTIAILKRLSTECKYTGSKLIVVGFPALKDEVGNASAFSHLSSLADGQEIYTVNLTTAFNTAARSQSSPPRVICHLSETGHRIMADLLFEFLEKNHLTRTNVTDQP